MSRSNSTPPLAAVPQYARFDVRARPHLPDLPALTHWESVADELYGLDPAEFTATRDRRAGELRKAGDPTGAKQVKSLKRPSLPAWAVNRLARESGKELGRLVALGQQLRAAQARLSGDELRQLTRDRQRLIAELSGATKALAAARGHPLTDAAARQVEQTLAAALADTDAAAAVTSGRLVTPLEHAGMGPVDLEGAVGGPPPVGPPEPRPEPEGDSRGEELARGKELARAEDDARRAKQAATEAEGRRRDAESELHRAETDLDQLEEQVAAARRRLEQARARADQEAQAEEGARRAAAESQRRLEDLRSRAS